MGLFRSAGRGAQAVAQAGQHPVGQRGVAGDKVGNLLGPVLGAMTPAATRGQPGLAQGKLEPGIFQGAPYLFLCVCELLLNPQNAPFQQGLITTGG